jgi:hypothetical protein
MRIQNLVPGDSNSPVKSTAAPSMALPVAPEHPVGKTLIMNEGMAIDDGDSLRLVIQSIMRTNRDEAEIESLTQAVLALQVSLGTHDAVAAAREAFLNTEVFVIPLGVNVAPTV